jgi:hypothetical protein
LEFFLAQGGREFGAIQSRTPAFQAIPTSFGSNPFGQAEKLLQVDLTAHQILF